MADTPKRPARTLIVVLIALLVLNLTLLLLMVVPMIRTGRSPLLELLGAPEHAAQASTLEPSAIPSETPTTAFISSEDHSTPLPSLAPPTTDTEGLQREGMIIFSMRDGNHAHLFAYHPLYLSFTRLTEGAWDDQDPAISPDGTRLAFASDRSGFWDIYVLDLRSQALTQLTNSGGYEGHPTWSPDGQWLAFEAYMDGNMEIIVRSLADLNTDPIRLTNDPAADTAPSWAPGGREIAFISDRSGNSDVWLARLDQVDDRYQNISFSRDAQESNPAWSPDGASLAWTTLQEGINRIVITRLAASSRPFVLAQGSHPVWSPDSRFILAEIRMPAETGFQVFSVVNGELVYPLNRLPGAVFGSHWGSGAFAELMNTFPYPANANQPAPALWSAALSTDPMPPNGRFGIVPVMDLSAPYPYFNDSVDEAFVALRQQIGIESGWDFLSSLENAYFPLTEPPYPGMEFNWLLTGRAFAVNPLPMQAGWMVMVREDHTGEIYWRLYIKARQQDGSTGKPLTARPWNLYTRYQGEPGAYEEGGSAATIPEGYWVDFTEVAARYGWQRLPSLSGWRSYYQDLRFNQYILTDGLDWNAAMAEVYPYEALVTATFIPTSTYTPTPTVTPSAAPVILPSATTALPPSATLAPATITPTPTMQP